MYLSCIYLIWFSFKLNLPMIIISRSRGPLFSLMQIACTLKGGRLSIATQGLLLALQPSPPGLVHGIATWHTSDG